MRRPSPPRSEFERQQHVLGVAVDRVGGHLVTSVVRKYCGEKEYGCPDRFEVVDIIERATSYFGVDGCEAEPMHRALRAHQRGELWPKDEDEAREFAMAMRDAVHKDATRSRSEHEACAKQVKAEQRQREQRERRERRERRREDAQRDKEQRELREQRLHDERTSPGSKSPLDKVPPTFSQKVRPPLPPRPSGERKSTPALPSRSRPSSDGHWKAEPQPEGETDSSAETSPGVARQLARMRCARHTVKTRDAW